MSIIEPFVRWAGGKSWLVPYIHELIKKLNINHYHEPFLGGGAVFLSFEHKKVSYLSDANSLLINTYIQIRDNPLDVIHCLQEFTNSEEEYYSVRDQLTQQATVENAARFLYLNQTSYNGIFRVSKSGKYNVPYGFRTSWNYDENRIIKASDRLKKANIRVGDFEVNKYCVKTKDLVFLDPPYTVSHNNNGFIEYNRDLFSLNDQYRLKRYIDYIKRKGAYYILTNAAHSKIKEIFGNENDRMIEITRKSLIGGRNARRGDISEYIFTNIVEE